MAQPSEASAHTTAAGAAMDSNVLAIVIAASEWRAGAAAVQDQSPPLPPGAASGCTGEKTPPATPGERSLQASPPRSRPSPAPCWLPGPAGRGWRYRVGSAEQSVGWVGAAVSRNAWGNRHPAGVPGVSREPRRRAGGAGEPFPAGAESLRLCGSSPVSQGGRDVVHNGVFGVLGTGSR